MIIEVHHIPSDGLEIRDRQDADRFPALKELEGQGACDFIEPVAATLHLAPMRDFIRVEGAVTSLLRLSCARCLEAFKHRIQSRFSLNFSKQIPKDVHPNGSEGIELTAQQIGIVFYEGDKIDFSTAIQEQVVLAIPFKPLCRQNCLGLCSQCGQNLNRSECRCDAQTPVGPFDALKNLKLPSQ
jgi:uncharacterized protein